MIEKDSRAEKAPHLEERLREGEILREEREKT